MLDEFMRSGLIGVRSTDCWRQGRRRSLQPAGFDEEDLLGQWNHWFYNHDKLSAASEMAKLMLPCFQRDHFAIQRSGALTISVGVDEGYNSGM